MVGIEEAHQTCWGASRGWRHPRLEIMAGAALIRDATIGEEEVSGQEVDGIDQEDRLAGFEELLVRDLVGGLCPWGFPKTTL